MQVGDLVKRKIPWKHTEYAPQPDDDGHGVVIALNDHSFGSYIQVFFHRTARTSTVRYDKLEVVSESR